MHGGTVEKQAFALQLRGVTEEGMARMAGMHSSADLLDAKIPVAVHRALLEQAMVIPTEAEVMLWAERIAKKRALDMGLEGEALRAAMIPTELDAKTAHMRLASLGSRLLIDHQNLQTGAIKVMQLEDVLRMEVLPILTQFSAAVRELIAKYVPRDKQEAFAQDLQAHLAQTLVRAEEAMREAAGVTK